MQDKNIMVGNASLMKSIANPMKNPRGPIFDSSKPITIFPQRNMLSKCKYLPIYRSLNKESMRLNNSRKAAVQAIDSIAYCEVPGFVGYPHTFHSRQFLESRFRMLECTLEYTLQFQLGFQNQTLLCLSHS